MRKQSADSDHTDQDSDDNYPSHKVRMGAYSRMMENRTDKTFQQREEAEVNRTRTYQEGAQKRQTRLGPSAQICA
eukprot:6016323-Heterocapsa_arctica.AAC.1